MAENKDIHAFPFTTDTYTADAGLTMRDYFAANIIIAYMNWSLDQPTREGEGREGAAARYAKVSYEIADAMIAARDK